jgi:hypothetical protein
MHHPLLQLQLLPQTPHPEEHHQGSTIDLGLLWLPLLGGLDQAPQEAAEEEEVEAVEEGEEAAVEKGEEAAVEDNQLLSLYSSLSLSPQPLTYKPWECSPESSIEKETKPTHS